MPRTARFTPRAMLPALCSVALCVGCLAAGAAPAATIPAVPFAHSAQIEVTASEQGQDLELAIQRVSDHSAVVSPDVRVSVDGRNVPVSPRGEGRYGIRLSESRNSAPLRIELEVPHDGIRELLAGRLSLDAGGRTPGGGLLGSHTQIAWWILNVIVVLVAAIALSKRKG